MKLEDLQLAQTAVATRFDDLERQKNEINAEQLRLQGEHRVYQSQIDTFVVLGDEIETLKDTIQSIEKPIVKHRKKTITKEFKHV